MSMARIAALALVATAGIAIAQTPPARPGSTTAEPAAIAPPAAAGLDGGALFAANCAACHQAKGEGIPGAFPALAGDAFVVGDEKPVVLTLLNGRGGMPAFRDDLKDDQLAAIISFVRASWGNHAAAVAPATFAALRAGEKTTIDRPIPAH